MNRSELLRYIENQNAAFNALETKGDLPYLQSDFVLILYGISKWSNGDTTKNMVATSDMTDSKTSVIIQEFNIPDVGLSMKESQERFGLLVPEMKYGNFTYDYIVPASKDITKQSGTMNVPQLWWNNQFEDGLLKFSSSEGETLELKLGTRTIFTASGCRFSRPVPTASQKSNSFVVYKQVVSFQKFSYEI